MVTGVGDVQALLGCHTALPKLKRARAQRLVKGVVHLQDHVRCPGARSRPGVRVVKGDGLILYGDAPGPPILSAMPVYRLEWPIAAWTSASIIPRSRDQAPPRH
jgi:hypothetical protein